MNLLDTRYPFMTAYLKGEEARLVTSDHVSKMSRSSDIQDILTIIRETDVGSYLKERPIETFDDLEKNLWEYFDDCIKRIEWFKPVPADMLRIIAAYVLKYDILNIKSALQAVQTGRQAHMIPIGIINNYGLLEELSSAESIDDVRELLNKCQLVNCASALEEFKVDEKGDSRLLAEAKLDGEYYRDLLEMTKGIADGTALAKTFGISIDLRNLQIIFRTIIMGIDARAVGYIISGGYSMTRENLEGLLELKLNEIPNRVDYLYQDMAREIVGAYDRTGSVTVIDEIIEKHKFRLSKEILSPRLLSPLLIAWYLILKEIEIRNLRLILKMTLDNIDLEEIKNYLVLPS